jgi:hypothetical protein
MHLLNPLSLIGSFFAGLLSAYFAYKQGRNLYLWFCLGFLLGIFGVLFMFFMGKQKKKPVRKKITPVYSITGPKDKSWYYLDPEHKQSGPMSLDALTREWRQGKISESTYVWNEELTDWKILKNFISRSQ